MRTKYTWLELCFADRYQWVRKRAKALWVRQLPDGLWVRFNEEETKVLEHYGIDFNRMCSKPDMESEDWRK